jgi:arsenate reductase (thioredoxin)
MNSILFLCVHNSARSQMAEAYTKRFASDLFLAESAGLEPGRLNPYVVRAMKEDGIDIAGNPTRSVMDLFRQGRTYRYVITVCSKEAAERCPIFPGIAVKLHWPFPDPAAFTGTDEEIMAQVRTVRDQIKEKVQKFIEVARDAE